MLLDTVFQRENPTVFIVYKQINRKEYKCYLLSLILGACKSFSEKCKLWRHSSSFLYALASIQPVRCRWSPHAVNLFLTWPGRAKGTRDLTAWLTSWGSDHTLWQHLSRSQRILSLSWWYKVIQIDHCSPGSQSHRATCQHTNMSSQTVGSPFGPQSTYI